MIADLCVKHDVLCISDEVYEWLTYDGAKHVKIGEILYRDLKVVVVKSDDSWTNKQTNR